MLHIRLVSTHDTLPQHTAEKPRFFWLWTVPDIPFILTLSFTPINNSTNKNWKKSISANSEFFQFTIWKPTWNSQMTWLTLYA